MASGAAARRWLVAGRGRFEVVRQQDRGQRRRMAQTLRLLLPQPRELAQLGRVLPVQREQLVEAQPEHAPVEPEAPVERQHRAAQHRHLAERVMLGILLQRLEAPRDVDDLGLRLRQRRRILIAGPSGRARGPRSCG